MHIFIEYAKTIFEKNGGKIMSELLTMFSQLMVTKIDDKSQWSFLNPVLEVLASALVPILIIVGTAGMIYAIVLGVKLARAETTDARDEAKKRLINAVIALVVMIALILLLQLFTDNIANWIGDVAEPKAETTDGTKTTGAIITGLRMMLGC